jgi:zinc/manganese transport system substrate-binding protein
MKRTTLKILFFSALTGVSLCPTLATAAEPLPVVASFSILGDLVKVVGAERVRVTTLVGPDQDAHAFEPKPADAKAMLAAKLFVSNGLNFEPWANKLAKSVGYKGETVLTSQGVKPILKSDPHAWQNPLNVIVYVRNIATGLAQVDAAGATSYQANAEAYVKELEKLDTWALAQFAAIPADKRQVITSHDAFGYLADRYKIKFLAPQGISSDTEPSAKGISQLIRQIKREKIKALFVENISNPKLIAQIGQDTGASVGASLYSDALSAPKQPGTTYLLMMRHNVMELVAGMKLN